MQIIAEARVNVATKSLTLILLYILLLNSQTVIFVHLSYLLVLELIRVSFCLSYLLPCLSALVWDSATQLRINMLLAGLHNQLV